MLVSGRVMLSITIVSFLHSWNHRSDLQKHSVRRTSYEPVWMRLFNSRSRTLGWSVLVYRLSIVCNDLIMIFYTWPKKYIVFAQWNGISISMALSSNTAPPNQLQSSRQKPSIKAIYGIVTLPQEATHLIGWLYLQTGSSSFFYSG